MMWVTVPQILGLPGLSSSDPRCREWLQLNDVPSRPRTSRGGGHEYLATGLPPEAQQALAARATGMTMNLVKPAATAISEAARTRKSAKQQAAAASTASLEIRLSLAGGFDPAVNPKLDLLQRFETYYRGRGGCKWPAIVEFCALWGSRQIEAHPGTVTAYPSLPAKSLDKWHRAWCEKGIEALLKRKPRSDKGQSQLTRDEATYDAFVAAMAEMHDPTARQVRRVLSHQIGSEQVPSSTTVKRWLCTFKAQNQVALLKFKNPDGWRNKYMPAFGSRSEHITLPNEEWQLDSTIADGQQRVDLAFNLTDGQTGEIRRHALVAMIDVFTRRMQVVVSRTTSANAIKAVTRNGVLAFGLPQRVKTDNGKDYTAVDFDFALQALKVEHLLCTPFSPDQKPFIERGLGTLLHDLFPMLAGFVGHDVAMRKAIESAKSFAQRFGDKGVDLHMSPEQLQGVIDSWVDEYHDRVHSELGCTPNQMAERHVRKITQVDARALDLFMMPVAGNGLRMVTKRGIALGNAWFAAAELAGVMGQQVYCRQDEADLGALHVFDLDGTYVCRALDHTMLGINRAELAARTRVIESQTIKPMVDALRTAKRKGLTRQAVNSLYVERQETAADAAQNVHRISPRVVQQTTDAIASVLSGQNDASAQDALRDAARASLEAAPVQQMLESPRQRYSAWVRLTARVAAAEQIAARDLEWLRSYEGSNEFQGWHAMQAGTDPLEQASGQ